LVDLDEHEVNNPNMNLVTCFKMNEIKKQIQIQKQKKKKTIKNKKMTKLNQKGIKLQLAFEEYLDTK